MQRFRKIVSPRESARSRPCPLMDVTISPPGQTCFKATSPDRSTRNQQTSEIFPTFGVHLNGGFLSHVAGKVIFRTGIDGLNPRIHNVFLGDQKNPGQQDLLDTELCHLHAPSLDAC